jgi:hypothetical protein
MGRDGNKKPPSRNGQVVHSHLPLIRQAGSAEAFVGSAATGRERLTLYHGRTQTSTNILYLFYSYFIIDRKSSG